MPATLTYSGRVQRKLLPCGVPIDPDSCPCPNVAIITPASSEEESVGRGERENTSAGSCQSPKKFTTEDIEVSIYLDRIFSIFCRTIKKLELSASLNLLLVHPELPHTLSKEDFRLVTYAFRQYIHIEPCHWLMKSSKDRPFIPARSESLQPLDPAEDSLKSTCSSTNLGNFDPKIYQAIEILNSYMGVREMVKELRPEYSEQADLFLGYAKYFIEHSLKRMHMSPEECRAKDLHFRKLWRVNEKAKIDIRTLTVTLDEQRKRHNTQMELIDAQCEKDLATVKRVNKKCTDDIKHTMDGLAIFDSVLLMVTWDYRIKSERKMMMMYKASEMRQKEVREDLINAESHLKTIRTFNLALEKEARDKRYKIESQLLGAINKYDTEIGEQQKQMEDLIAEFEADKKMKQDLEAEIEKQSEMFNALMIEKQEASEAIINEKLAKLMLLRVVKIIQRWWRGIRDKRKAKTIKTKKKNTKNKKKK